MREAVLRSASVVDSFSTSWRKEYHLLTYAATQATLGLDLTIFRTHCVSSISLSYSLAQAGISFQMGQLRFVVSREKGHFRHISYETHQKKHVFFFKKAGLKWICFFILRPMPAPGPVHSLVFVSKKKI